MVRFPQKLLIPTAGRSLVERPDQLARLNATIINHRATVLIAPAGWGKTSALGQWAQQAPLPIAWYALDRADRDPFQFMAYILSAVAPFAPAAAAQAQHIAQAHPREFPNLVRDAAGSIAEVSQPFALILDDLHLLTDSDEDGSAEHKLILEFLANIIDYAPACHLVLASRTLPRSIPGLVRQVAQRRVAVLDFLALQWSAEDIQRLAAQQHAAPVDAAAAGTIAERYNGWVMGITLALEQAQQGETMRSLGGANDGQEVYAFLAEQVIAPLPVDMQQFLEATSVLDDLSVERCNKLCERNDSAKLFDELSARGLFLSRRGAWLSYHALFRDFLRDRLAREPERHRQLLQRAGDLYAAEEDIERSIACYTEVGNHKAAYALLRTAVPRFRQRSQQLVLLRCFDLLRERSLGSRSLMPPDLLLQQARVYGDLAFWERAYVALDLIESLGDQAMRWAARILRADLLTIQGDKVGARASLNSIPPIESLPGNLHLNARFTAGRLAILEGNTAQAIALLNTAVEDISLTDATVERSDTLATIFDLLGYAYALQRRNIDAIRCVQRADAYWQVSGNNGRRTLTLNNLGSLAIDEWRLIDARNALTTALALAEESVYRREEANIRLSLADLELAEGNFTESLAQYKLAYAQTQHTKVLSHQYTAICGVAWVAALSNDKTSAENWLARLEPDAYLSTLLRGRLLLTKLHIALLENHLLVSTQNLFSEVAAVAATLGPIEQVALLLLQANKMYQEGSIAQINWVQLKAAITPFPDALLQALVALHSALFAVAPAELGIVHRVTQPTKPDMPRWSITSLGNFSCLVEGQPRHLSVLHRAIVTRLLDAGPGGVSIDRLWEDVWGDEYASQAAIHKAFSRIRKQTELEAVASHGHCSIRSDWQQISYDVQRFERALAEPPTIESLQRAIDSYGGEFVLGAVASAQTWVEARRNYLQQRYLHAMEQLALLYEPSAPERSILLYQQVLQIDPRREQTATRLMELAAQVGNRALVASTYTRLSEALESLSLTPLPATVSLYRHLR
jgi:ATP/maltotriose-dependent transcriptional regulator MalT/DNA-binding SARP family transcriptional activator